MSEVVTKEKKQRASVRYIVVYASMSWDQRLLCPKKQGGEVLLSHCEECTDNITPEIGGHVTEQIKCKYAPVAQRAM